MSLEIFSNNDIVWKAASHCHVLLLVDHACVRFHFDVALEALLVLPEVVEGKVRLLELVLEVADALVQLVDLLQQLVVGGVVAVLHVGSPRSLLKPSLRHAQWRVFCRNV